MIAPAVYEPGPYTLSHLGQALLAHAPAVLRGVPQLIAGFRNDRRLDGATRIAVQLRLATLLGCPVCRGLFPALARRAGVSEAGVQAALHGDGAALPAQTAAALAWVEAIVRAGGDPPAPVEAAAALSGPQRDHLVVLTRLDLIIHSVGLMFLPRSMIEQAFVA